MDDLTSRRICDLGLRLDGSLFDAARARLRRELDAVSIAIDPKLYLSDGWGCPDRVPVIGVPFYLASPDVARVLERAVDDVEDDDFVARAMRHEAAHAFNYAHRLRKEPRWEPLFGSFDAPYPETYAVVPFHPDFVRHLDGWYGQRHADDDFAETMAVWLRDGDAALAKYASTRAGKKLEYVADLARRFGRATPVVTCGDLDVPIESMTETLGEFVETRRRRFEEKFPRSLEAPMARVFAEGGPAPAAPWLTSNRARLVESAVEATDEAAYFGGRLCRRLERAARDRELRFDPARETELRERMIALVTALLVRYAFTRSFVAK